MSTVLIVLITVVSISDIAIYQVNKKNYNDYLSNSKEQMSIVSQAITIFYDQIDKNLNMIATNSLIDYKNASRICERSKFYWLILVNNQMIKRS